MSTIMWAFLTLAIIACLLAGAVLLVVYQFLSVVSPYILMTFGARSEDLHWETGYSRPARLKSLALDGFKRRRPSGHREQRASGEAQKKTRRHVTAIFDLWAMVLPVRIANEDLGDYEEAIHSRISRGQKVRAYLNAVSAIFWTGVATIGYLLKNLGKRSGA
jgi:hypothetical protein